MFSDSARQVAEHFMGKSIPERADALQNVIRGYKLGEAEATIVTAVIMHPEKIAQIQSILEGVGVANRIDDPEFLTDIVDEVMHAHDAEREELLAQFLPTLTPEQRALYNKLDDISITEACTVQTRTLDKLRDVLVTAAKPAVC